MYAYSNVYIQRERERDGDEGRTRTDPNSYYPLIHPYISWKGKRKTNMLPDTMLCGKMRKGLGCGVTCPAQPAVLATISRAFSANAWSREED